MTGTVLGLLRRHRLVACASLVIGSSCLSVALWQQTVSPRAEATEAPEVKLVKVLEVAAQSIPNDRRAVGEIRSRHESDLGFRVSGKLIERRVDVGVIVKQGDVLARIDDRDYRNRLLSAEADRVAAEAALIEAQAAEHRARVLLQKGYTTRANHDGTLKDLRSAEAKLDATNAALAIARDELAHTELHADFSGVVTAVGAEPGQIVSVGAMIVRIADPNAKDAVFSIAEAAFGADSGAHDLPPVMVSLLSNPEVTATGTVREISPIADAATKTYEVKVSLDNASDAMRFGASVAGRVATEAELAVVIPTSALFHMAGRPAVWVVGESSQVKLKPIWVARFEADRVVVSSGLAEGDLVVTAGVNRLYEQQTVRTAAEGD